MEGVLALLFLCATAQFAHGHHFSNIHTSDGLLGPKLLGMTASVLSVIGSAYSHSSLQLPNHNTSENVIDVYYRENITSSIAGPRNAMTSAESEASGSNVSTSASAEANPGSSHSSASSSASSEGGKSKASSSASSEGGKSHASSSASSEGGKSSAEASASGRSHSSPPLSNITSVTEFSMKKETKYRCYHIGQKANIVSFRVKAAYSAYTCLMGEEKFFGPTYEVIIGDKGNTMTTYQEKLELHTHTFAVKTPHILSKDEFRGFWIKWDDGVITVGKESMKRPFMAYAVPDLQDIKHVCFFPGSRSARWIVHGIGKKW